MLNDKWNDLSPRDRKIISEVIIALIEIGLLRSSSKGKKAAFAILSSISRHQTPGKNDLEEFVEGVQGLFKRSVKRALKPERPANRLHEACRAFPDFPVSCIPYDIYVVRNLL